jgi:16S rRNA (adenine1518-N6/adenine1519-N6)-dimethyltransferase
MRAGERLALLRASGLTPKKSFGQNFLVSDPTIARIASTCVPDHEVGVARVVELGAGLGALTAALTERAGHVIAVERDRDLVPILASSMADPIAAGTLSIVEQDAQTLDLATVFRRPPEQTFTRVLAGNLPYQITGQLLRLAVTQSEHVDRVVFMVQREVADRLVALPRTKAYGALTVFVQAAFSVRVVMEVPPGAFVPPPGVSSAVVALTPHRPPVALETDTFRAVVKGAFAMRRKTLRNAWRGLVPNLPSLEEAALVAGVSLDARGETLDVAAFDRMAHALDARAEKTAAPIADGTRDPSP